MKIATPKTQKILFILSFMIGFYLLIHFLLIGLTGNPFEGDSIHMHIPIAKTILDGKIFQSDKSLFYPASAELILAIFIAFHIPLGIYNVLAVVLLFFAIRSLGLTMKFSRDMAMMLAFAVCSIYDILRYINTQKIDIWLLIFYTLSLQLLQKPEKKLSYYFLIGLVLGMFVGSKYSAPFYAFILFLFYGKGFIKSINIKRCIAFLIPFSLFGLSWYIRNYINFGDPFFPQNFIIFKGDPHSLAYAWPFWKIAVADTKELVNAFVSEYMIWMLSLVVVPIFALYIMVRKGFIVVLNQKILLLGLLNFILFLFLPAAPSHDYNAIVFGIRYSFPALLVLILMTFSIANLYKKNMLVSIITFANMCFLIVPFSYHPKLVFVFVPMVTAALLGIFRYRRKNLK